MSTSASSLNVYRRLRPMLPISQDTPLCPFFVTSRILSRTSSERYFLGTVVERALSAGTTISLLKVAPVLRCFSPRPATVLSSTTLSLRALTAPVAAASRTSFRRHLSAGGLDSRLVPDIRNLSVRTLLVARASVHTAKNTHTPNRPFLADRLPSTRASTTTATQQSRKSLRQGSSSRPHASLLAAKMSSAAPVKAMTTEPRRNTCCVIHAAESAQVSLDLCFDWPQASSQTASDGSASTFISKLLVRDASEEAAKTLERIQMLCPTPGGPSKKAGKRLSREAILASCPPVRALGVQVSTPSPLLPRHDVETPLAELDPSLPNSAFFAALRTLLIGSQEVNVVYNPPAITGVQPLPKPFAGVPLFCQPPTTLNCGPDDVSYEWYALTDGAALPNPASSALTEGVRPVSTERLFYPTEDLVGKTLVLRLSVNPTVGPWVTLRAPAPVAALPPPMDRWAETRTYMEAVSAFRVTSYNVLYDGFCDTKACRERIYPFASDEILSIENRQARILQELIAHHSDIICLQECGKHLLNDYLLPSMRHLGYDGFYVNKSGRVQEGCALLFRTARFELLTHTSFPLNWATLAERYPQLAASVAEHDELKAALSHVTTIASLSVLREKTTRKELVVGNTHLFYHANACHIRLLQAYMVMDALARLALGAREDANPSSPAFRDTVPCAPPLTRRVVLCGDLNCTHTTGAYRLLTTGQVESTHHSWDKGKLFWWGCDRQLGYSEEEFETLTGKKSADGKRPKKEPIRASTTTESDGTSVGVEITAVAKAGAERAPLTNCFRDDLHVPLRLTDAYDRTDPSLPWTNYTMTFREVIDYILFSQNVDVLRTIPIPPEAELCENFALPNRKYPSDHVALIADLVFRE